MRKYATISAPQHQYAHAPSFYTTLSLIAVTVNLLETSYIQQSSTKCLIWPSTNLVSLNHSVAHYERSVLLDLFLSLLHL